MLRELKNIEDTYEHIRVEQAAMTGRNTLPPTAAGVVGTIKHVWYLVVVAFAVHNASNIFRRHFKLKYFRWHV